MKKNKKLAKVYHYDLYGKREEKYKFLDEHSVNNIEWNELEYKEPYYFFVPKDFDSEKNYQKHLQLSKLFLINNSGVSTDRDSLFLDDIYTNLSERIEILLGNNYDSDFKNKFNINDSSGYPLLQRINNKDYSKDYIIKYHYRPFDIKYIYFDTSIISRSAKLVTNHLLNQNNYTLILPRQVNTDFQHIFISDEICDSNITSSARLFGAGSVFPLYLYPEAGEQATLDKSGREATSPSFGHPSRGEELGRKPNLDMKLVGEIAKGLGLEFRDVAPWDEDGKSSLSREDLGGLKSGKSPQPPLTRGSTARNDMYFAPIDLLDYIYAVLHSPTYREKYKEFLKIDFPRVPYPKDKKKFWELVDLGSQIRQLHLLETADKYITSYPNDGSNIVERKMTKNSIGYEQTGDGIGRVWINDEQYFDGVPSVAWEFYIGGYQPAQKWLKDRVGRELNFEDINHYQKIIVALTETDRLMKEVDLVGVE